VAKKKLKSNFFIKKLKNKLLNRSLIFNYTTPLNMNQLTTSSNFTYLKNASLLSLFAGFIICAAEIPLKHNSTFNRSRVLTPYVDFFNKHILPLGGIALIGGCYGLSICWLKYSIDCL
jgi:hypothetical protein